mgnify:CR=1 FL=1
MQSRMHLLCCIGGVAFAAFAFVTLGGDRIAATESGGYDDDLRAQFLSMPLNPNLGGDGSVDAFGPRAYRSISANARNQLLKPFLFGQRLFEIEYVAFCSHVLRVRRLLRWVNEINVPRVAVDSVRNAVVDSV